MRTGQRCLVEAASPSSRDARATALGSHPRWLAPCGLTAADVLRVGMVLATTSTLLACQPQRTSNTPAATNDGGELTNAEASDASGVCEALCARHRACPAASQDDVAEDAATSSVERAERSEGRHGPADAAATSPRVATPTEVSTADGDPDGEASSLDAWCMACDEVRGDPAREAAWRSAATCGGLDACEALRACVSEAIHDALAEAERSGELDDEGRPLAPDSLAADAHTANAVETRDGTSSRRSTPPSRTRRAPRRPTPPGANAGENDDDDACVPYCDRALTCGVGEPDASEARILELRAAADAPWFECLRTCRLERAAGRGERLDACLAAPTCDGFAPCLADE